MASDKPAVSFDAIVQAGRESRERKKAEELAKTIFGKGRRDSAPNHLGPRKHGPSLASRISKPNQRSASSSSTGRVSVTTAYKNASKLNRTLQQAQSHINGQNNVQGFSIKGAAGPYVVVGSNFAPGTTAEDIKSAMEPVSGEMMSCVVITSNPTVIVEMVYAEKAAAEMAIGTFNNQKADGRLLHLFLKQGPAMKLIPPVAPEVPSRSPAIARVPSNRSDLFSDRSGGRAPRQQSNGMAEPEWQDGRYGFEAKQDESMEIDQPPIEENREEPRREESRREYQDNNYRSDRTDRRDYRQDYSRSSNQRSGGYSSRGNRPNGQHQSQYQERLYSDNMYSRPRGNGYR